MNVMERMQKRIEINYRNEAFKSAQSEKISNAVEEFKKDYCSFFEGGDIRDSVTQNYWYGLYLGKRRLDKLQLTKTVKFDKAKYKTVAGADEATFTGLLADEDRSVYQGKEMIWNSDGKSLSVEVRENLVSEEIYQRLGKKVGRFKEEEIGCFSVVESASTKDQYVCPNCGGVNSTANLIDGCEFCGSKFELKDFRKKIAGFFTHPDVAHGAVSWIGNMGKIVPIFVFGVFILMFLGFFVQNTDLGQTYLRYLMASVSILMPVLVTGTFAAVFLRYILAFYRKKGRASHNPVMNEIRKNNREFTIERFWSALEYKLKAFHFAEDPQEVSEYCEFDCAPMLSSYQNVVGCEYKDGYLIAYHKSGNEQQIRAAVDLKISRLCKNRVKQTIEKVIITMKTDTDTAAISVNDAVMYRCPDCGSTISLLNGGVCESCGHKLDLSKYDWVVNFYQINSEKKQVNKVWWLYLIAGLVALYFSFPFLAGAFKTFILQGILNLL